MQNAISLMKVAEGSVARSIDIMRTMKEKAINAANDTNTDEDRAIIQKELDQSIDQIDDNSQVTFNGKYLFTGEADRTYSTKQTIIAALYSEWLPNSLDLIKSSTGLSFDAGDPSVKEIDVRFSNEGGDVLAYVTSILTGDETTELSLTINMDFYDKLHRDDVNGSSESAGAGYLDRTIAHEMTHAVMSANIEGYDGLTDAITEGAAESIHGVDDTRNLKDLAKSTADMRTVLEKAPGTADTNDYGGGFIMFRYLANNSGGYTAEESFTRFMKSLASGSGAMTTDRIDAAVSAASKGRFATYDDLKTSLLADQAAANAVDSTGKKFLLDCCGINLDNDKVDVGPISGFDAGSRFHKNAENTVYEAGSTRFWTNPTESVSYINGLQVKWPADEVTIKGGLFFQIGTKANQNISIAMSNMDAEALGLRDDKGNNLQVTTQQRATAAIYQLDKSLERAINQQTYIGAVTSRLEMTADNITTAHENTTNAESVIRDADMAMTMTEYTKFNVLAQAAQSMLAQANQNSSNVLSLLQ